MLSYTTHRN